MSAAPTPMARMVQAAIDYILSRYGHPATARMLYLALTDNGRQAPVTQTAFAQHLGRAAGKLDTIGARAVQYRPFEGAPIRDVPIYYRKKSASGHREVEALRLEIKAACAEYAAPGLDPLQAPRNGAGTPTTAAPGEFALAMPPRFDLREAGTYIPPTSLPAARAGAEDHLRHKSHGLRC